MKIVYFTFLCLIFAACNSDKTRTLRAYNAGVTIKTDNNSVPFRPYRIAGDFTVTDTGYFNTGEGDGVYAVVKRSNMLIDTISKTYSIKSMGNGRFFYLTIEGRGEAKGEDSNPRYTKSIYGSVKSYIILDGQKKTSIATLSPDFDDYFSSPAVINSKIYFWAIKKLDSTGRIKISAAQYDQQSRSTESHYVMDDILETDDEGYYPSPFLKNDTICFVYNKKKQWKFSPSFKQYK